MQKQTRFYPIIAGVALATAIILLIPFIAMQFTNEVAWSLTDFILAGVILFSTGLALVTLIRLSTNIVYKAGVVLAIGATFLLIWANLAVGLIGSGPNPGNLMYIGVLVVVIVSSVLSRFTPKGMELAMFASAITLVLVAAIALLANMQQYPGSSVFEIIIVNAFFVGLFTVSGLLFHYAAQHDSKKAVG